MDVRVFGLGWHHYRQHKALAPRNSGRIRVPARPSSIALAFHAVKGPVFAFEAWPASFAKCVFLQRCKHTTGDLLGLVGAKTVIEARSVLVCCGQRLQRVFREAKVQIAGLEGFVAGVACSALRFAFGHRFGCRPSLGFPHECQRFQPVSQHCVVEPASRLEAAHHHCILGVRYDQR